MTQKYDFDQIVDRYQTDSEKWSIDAYKEKFNEPNIKYPCWIADMDFLCPPEVNEAIEKRAKHAIFGYSSSKEPNKAYIKWAKEHFNWDIEPEWLLHTPGVVTAIRLAVQTFTDRGDKVLIQRPVYYPFTDAIESNGRKVVSNSLVLKDSRYEIDFDDFAKKCADPDTKMFIMCSPHNPVGRVWTKDELLKMLQICSENHVFVLADEIHNDLVLPGNKHYVAANLDSKYADNIMTCTAPTKTFNLAGLQFSNVIIQNPQRRHDLNQTIENAGIETGGPFAMVAVPAAYNKGADWLNELLDYLQASLDWVKKYLAENMPQVKIYDHQGTYLLWLDFRSFGLSDEELANIIYHDALVAMDGGTWFGPEGSGFMRFNLACPLQKVQEAFDSMQSAFVKHNLI